MGPKTQAGDMMHGMKYRSKGEDYRESCNREAMSLKDDDDHWGAYREIRLDMRFMSAGRIQSAAGSLRQTTSFNCFVSGTIMDSYTDNDGSIMQRAHEAAATMRMGGGIGYDWSTLRPRGDLIKRLQSMASGPRSFMDIYDAVCRCTSSSGHRRGAQMAVLRIDHPDIEEFILCKGELPAQGAIRRACADLPEEKRREVEIALQAFNALTGFNISVAVTDEFMEAVEADKEFTLKFGGRDYRTTSARELWERVMRGTHDFAEPGVIFIDRINEMNNLKYCETIAATNPCGEQPLPPFGACLLGSINLPRYLLPLPTPRDASGPRWYLDKPRIREDIPHIVRAMDNVTDRTRYPLAMQRVEAMAKRRMGIGVMGLANAAEACGYPYGSIECINFTAEVLELIRDECYRASVALCRDHKKPTFPAFDAEKYLAGKFIQRLPEDIRHGIAKYGIRNSHLTSIAPTGTISMCADNVTGGIEPVWAHEVERPVNTPDGQIKLKVQDYGVAFLGVRGKKTDEVSAAEHTAMLCTAQQFVDSAVSKTINMDSKTMSWDQFKGIYKTAWENGAKGCTTFNKSGLRMGLLTEVSADGATCQIDTETGRRDCA